MMMLELGMVTVTMLPRENTTLLLLQLRVRSQRTEMKRRLRMRITIMSVLETWRQIKLLGSSISRRKRPAKR